jgi:hypothetical protein
MTLHDLLHSLTFPMTPVCEKLCNLVNKVVYTSASTHVNHCTHATMVRIQWSRVVLMDVEDGKYEVLAACHGIARGDLTEAELGHVRMTLPMGVRPCGTSASASASDSTSASGHVSCFVKVLSRLDTDPDAARVFATFRVLPDLVPDCFHSIWDLTTGSLAVLGSRVLVVGASTGSDSGGGGGCASGVPGSMAGGMDPITSNTVEIIDRTKIRFPKSSALVCATRALIGDSATDIQVHAVGLHNTGDKTAAMYSIECCVSPDTTSNLCLVDMSEDTPTFLTGFELWSQIRKVLGSDAFSFGDFMNDLLESSMDAGLVPKQDSTLETDIHLVVRCRTRLSKTCTLNRVYLEPVYFEEAMFDVSEGASGMALRFIKVHVPGTFVVLRRMGTSNEGVALWDSGPEFKGGTVFDCAPLATARDVIRDPFGVLFNGGNPLNGISCYDSCTTPVAFLDSLDPHVGARLLLWWKHKPSTPDACVPVRVTLYGTTPITTCFINHSNVMVIGSNIVGVLPVQTIYS